MQHDKGLLIHEFLLKKGQIVDLRTPAEFKRAHIPKAINIPIFSDEERKEVGKVFKLQGPFKAMQLGLKYVGPKLSDIVTRLKENKKFPIQVYCSRGGMRSQAMVWLLNFCQLDTHFLISGYKSYRRWTLDLFSKNYTFYLLQPFLGSSMSAHLKKLKENQEQVLDFEDLANFSSELLPRPTKEQPTTEHFENLIADQLCHFDFQKPIWLQKVGKSVGDCKIPHGILKHLKVSPLYLFNVEKEKRIQNIADTLEKLESDKILSMISLFKKKLGTFKFKSLTQALEEKKYLLIADMLVMHFDKISSFHLKKHRGNLVPMDSINL